jgi:hypothetical protein
MDKLQQKLSRVIDKTHRKLLETKSIMPVKIPEGILVGDVKIVPDGCVKNLYQNGDLIFPSISLNCAAIKIANLLATRSRDNQAFKIWRADQDYGKWYTDCHFLMHTYQTALHNQDYEKADIIYSRYQQSKERARKAKLAVESLTRI